MRLLALEYGAGKFGNHSDLKSEKTEWRDINGYLNRFGLVRGTSR
jgi:hypothetical protein